MLDRAFGVRGTPAEKPKVDNNNWWDALRIENIVAGAERLSKDAEKAIIEPTEKWIDSVLPSPKDQKFTAADFTKGLVVDTMRLATGLPAGMAKTAQELTSNPFVIFPIVKGMESIKGAPFAITAANEASKSIASTAEEHPARLAGNVASIFLPTGAVAGGAKIQKLAKVADLKLNYVSHGGTLGELKAIKTIADNQNILGKEKLFEWTRNVKPATQSDGFSITTGIRNLDPDIARDISSLAKSAKPETFGEKVISIVNPSKYDPDFVAYGTGSNLGREVPMSRITSDLDIFVRTDKSFKDLVDIGAKYNKRYLVDNNGGILRKLESGGTAHAIDTHKMPNGYAGLKNGFVEIAGSEGYADAAIAYPFRVIPSKRGHLEFRGNEMVSERFGEQLRRKAAGAVGQFDRKSGKLISASPAEHRGKDVYDLVADSLQQAKTEAVKLSDMTFGQKVRNAPLYVGKKRAIRKNMKAVETIMKSPRLGEIVKSQHIKLANENLLTQEGKMLSLDTIADRYATKTPKLIGEFDLTGRKAANPLHEIVFAENTPKTAAPKIKPQAIDRVRITRGDEIREWKSPLASPSAMISGTSFSDIALFGNGAV